MMVTELHDLLRKIRGMVDLARLGQRGGYKKNSSQS